MKNYPDNCYSNIYPDFDFTHNDHTLDVSNIIVNIIKLGYGYYAVQYASGKRERITEALADEIAKEMNITIADRIN